MNEEYYIAYEYEGMHRKLSALCRIAGASYVTFLVFWHKFCDYDCVVMLTDA